jgi:hypothetical protein
VSGEIGTTNFEDVSDADQEDDVRAEAKERCLSCVFLRQSGKQHNKLKVDLQNNFTTGDNRHPKNQQSTLHVLDKHSKSTVMTTTTTLEGTAFAQRGDQAAKGDQNKGPCNKRNVGRRRNATIAIRWGILQRIAALRNLLTAVGIKRRTMRHPVLGSPAKQAASTSCKRK